MITIEQYRQLVFDVAEAKRQNGVDRPGWVYEQDKDKVRVCIGRRPDGSLLLSPWLHTADQRGGRLERQTYEKGQNVWVSCPGGDWRQARVTRYAESKSFPAPAHADKINGYSSQIGKLRISYHKPKKQEQQQGQQNGQQQQQEDDDTFYEIWLADQETETEPHQDQPTSFGQASDSEQVKATPKEDTASPVLKIRISEKSGVAQIRYGTDITASVHKNGAKVKAGSNFATATKDKVIVKAVSGDLYCHAEGQPWVNKPFHIKNAPPDPIPDDTK